MLRIPPPAIRLASFVAFLALLSAGPASAQPFLLVYASQPGASPACNLGIDPASLQGGNPAVAPVLPPIDVPVGQTRTAELCFLVWPVSSSGTGQIVCSNGSGTESCAEQLLFTTNAGIEIAAFTPVAPQDASGFPKYDARVTPHSLRLMGGHPIAGRQGSGLVGVSLGTISLFGVLPAGTFSLSDGSWVAANMQSRAAPDTAIATTLNQCGNGVLDPGEACEDGNAVFGDGCAPTCRQESDFTLEGATGPLGSTGSLALQIDGVDVVLDLASLPNAPAEEVMLALVTRVEDEPAIGATALQADDPSQPGADDGRRFVTDGEISGGPTLAVSNGTIAVPEPGFLAGLAAGIGLLAALHRRGGSRSRSRPRLRRRPFAFFALVLALGTTGCAWDSWVPQGRPVPLPETAPHGITPLALCERETGVLDCADDECNEWYQVDVPQAGTMRITLEQPGVAGEGALTRVLLKPLGKPVLAQQVSTHGEAVDLRVAVVPDVYGVLVQGAGGHRSYLLRVSVAPPGASADWGCQDTAG